MNYTQQQLAALAALNKKLPDELVTGHQASEVSRPDVDSEWLKNMLQISRDLSDRAAAYYNIQERKDRLSTTVREPRRVLSDVGFPATVRVSYADPPQLSYLAKTEPREIKHIVLHSFGHIWHAAPMKGGWLNRSTSGEGVEPYEYNGQVVYVAKGSDPTTLTHPKRFAAAMRAALGPASRSTAHFYIDRSGNLVIVGDVNYVMFVADAANETSISIALEEAFYLLEDPREQTAVWSPEGVPPGTAGNIKYFSFSPAQLLTLSIVCKKLETAFPNLAARNIDFTRRALTSDSASGYTMHDFIKGSKFVDISPHFLTRQLWNKFFELVDSHTFVNQTNIWKSRGVYKETNTNSVGAPISDEPDNPITERFLESSRSFGLGLSRAQLKATAGKAELMKDAGDRTSLDSGKVAQTAANIYNIAQQTSNLPVTLMEDDLPEEEQGGWDDTW